MRFFLRRVRALMGLLEAPKYHVMRLLFTPTRELLRPVGEELARSGRLSSPADVYDPGDHDPEQRHEHPGKPKIRSPSSGCPHLRCGCAP